MRLPDFFIVGAPKSGTTALHAYLGRHPSIFVPARKEPHFFGSDIVSPAFVRDRDAYLSLFAGATTEARVGEASIWYLYSKRAAREIKEFNPDARIIIMLRNPVDMLWSQHSQFLYNGNEDIEDFEEALAAEDDRRRGRRIPRSVMVTEGLFYRDTASYTGQVQRYFDVFGRDRVLVIIYDDFKADTAREYRRTLEFLGVDPGFTTDLAVINPNKRSRSTFLRDLLRNPSPWAVHAARLLVPVPAWRARLRAAAERWNTVYFKRPPMKPGLRARLQAEFAPEVERLGALLGRDLSGWCVPQAAPRGTGASS